MASPAWADGTSVDHPVLRPLPPPPPTTTFGSGAGAAEYLTNIAIGKLSSEIFPTFNIQLTDAVSFSFSPSILAGSEGLTLGANFGLTGLVNTGDMYSVTGLDIGLSTGGFRIGGGVEVGGKNFALGLNSTQYGGSASQRVGGAMMRIGDVKMRYENDWFFDAPLGDGGDGFRTAAASISYGDYSIGLNLYTAKPVEKQNLRLVEDNSGKRIWLSENDINKNNYCYVEESSPRLGALYFGYKDFRFGTNSEMIRYTIQNRIIHNFISHSPHFSWNESNSSTNYFNYQTRSRYSLW